MYAIVVSSTTPVKLSFIISLVTCTARPTTQPVVSDIRHAKQVPLLTILFAAHGTLALYPGFSYLGTRLMVTAHGTLALYPGSPPPQGLGTRLMVTAHGTLALYPGSPPSPGTWG